MLTVGVSYYVSVVTLYQLFHISYTTCSVFMCLVLLLILAHLVLYIHYTLHIMTVSSEGDISATHTGNNITQYDYV